MIFQIELAERIIEIHSMYMDVYDMCYPYIINRRFHDHPDIVIETTLPDLEYEKELVRVTEQKTNNESIVYSPGILETASVNRKLSTALLSYDTFLMHGSVVSTDGQGFMITAASGVGKTTRTDLWIKNIPGSIVVNGDKPFIRIAEEAVYVYGTPWCGKEGWNNNVRVPLHSVFILERADDEADSVKRLSFGEAFMAFYQQVYRPQNSGDMIKTLHLLKAMEGKVKFYRFRSKPTAESVQLAYDTACSDGKY